MKIFLDFSEYDETPHDYSLVVWAEKQPVVIRDAEHPEKETERFPVFTLDDDAVLTSLDGSVADPLDPTPGPDDGDVILTSEATFKDAAEYSPGKWY